jgi:hypothetical protein
MRVTESLRIEHRLIRQMMEAMSRWLTEGVEPGSLRERAVMLEAAIDLHTKREERQLLAPLNTHSGIARDLVVMLERVHVEVHSLFRELADPKSQPQNLLPKIIAYTDAHFAEEETGLFPLAEKLLPPERLEDDSPIPFPG